MPSWFTKLMMCQSEAYGGYISQGLAFQLDCKKNCTATTWKDLIGGIEFTGYGVTIVDDVPYFADLTNYYSSSTLGIAKNKTTIEAVFKPDDESKTRFAVITSTASDDIGFIKQDDYYQGVGLNQNIEKRFTANDTSGQIRTVSIAYDKLYDSQSTAANSRAYENGVELSLDSTDHGSEFLSTTDGTYVGNALPQGETSSWTLVGHIYAIRIYKRALTESEIKYNQAIDLSRFG